jgi:hypothetical protein
MAFFGLAFLVNVVHPTVPAPSAWYRWGVGGLLVFGVVFLAVGLYGALYRERMTGLIPRSLLVSLALPPAIWDGNVLGAILYSLFLGGGVMEAHTRYERARLRREWVIHVRHGDVP